MKLVFENKRIAGLVVVLPENEQTFDEDLQNFEFPKERSLKLKKIMGYDKHRVVQEDVCSSDLAAHGLSFLFNTGAVDPRSIDAMLVVTQTPDYLIPPTSSVLHGQFSFRQDMICLDITQGCAGYLIGLIQAFSLLEQAEVNNILVINCDVLSRKVSKRDRNSYPLIGDAAAITLVTKESSPTVVANVKHDGTGREALMIPAGGMRLPSSQATQIYNSVGDNNYRSLDNLVMDGTAVFQFVQREVPAMISEVMEAASVTDEEIFAYAFHQPNRFMLEKLCQKLGIPPSKVPMDIVEKFGNSSGASIPVVLANSFSQVLKKEPKKYCLAGFGVGLTWSSMVIEMGSLDFIQIIDDFKI